MCENDKEDVLVNQAESGAQEIEETVNAEGIITSVDDVDKGVNIDACTISTGVYVMPKIIVHSNILLDTRASTTGTELQKYPPKEVIENSTVQDEECSVEEEGAAATVRKKKKRLAILDSDSDEGEDTVTKTNSHKIAICNSDNLSGGEENSTLKDKQNRLKDLCDSDTASESEDETNAKVETPVKLAPVKSTITAAKSAKQKSAKTPKDNVRGSKMTAKQAAQERLEIHAESQRRTREANVSLPYHRPKTRTITEFLKKRPCLATAVPISSKIPASVAVKMSAQELALMSKKFEERKKEVEEFYKSETDSEEEDKENALKGDSNVLNQNAANVSNAQDVSNDEIKTQILEVGKEEQQSKDLENLNETETEKSLEANAEADPSVNKLDSVEHARAQNEAVSETVNETTAQELNSTACTQRNMCASNENMESIIANEETITNILTTADAMEETQNTSVDDKRISEEFTFNLDDIDEGNEVETERQHINTLIEKYSDSAQVVMTQKEEKRTKSRLALLQEKLANKPKLSGTSDDFIDLSESVPKRHEIAGLMERFMKHARPQLTTKSNEIHVSVINASQGEIRKEILTVPIEEEEIPVDLNEKPGAKLKKLREELQSKISQQRAELWQKKKQQLEENKQDENVGEDEQKEGFEEKILDDEEEEELTESEDEEEEDDIESYGKEKARKTSAFFDEEAEVSGDENKEVDVADEDEEAGEEEEEDEQEENIEEGDEVDTASKPRRRILNTFDEDSNSCDKNDVEETANFDSTVSWEDDGPPPQQKQCISTPVRLQTQSRSQLGFISPVVNLTGLQGMNSTSKFLLDSPVEIMRSPANAEPSPFRDKKWQSQLQKALFQDNTEQQTQKEAPSTQPEEISEIQVETQPSTQDLKEICSGFFTETSQVSEAQEVAQIQAENEAEAGGDQNVKVDDEDENFITQILNEDELEKFKQKFASPAVKNVVEEDDDDDDEEEIVLNRGKRKRLVFSDDEEESDGIIEEEEEETIGLCDVDDEEREVRYDSEENEIEEAAAPRMNLKDFIDKEAELSESDWGSEDEDERGLDKMEKEEGDEDKFDEDKLRTDLEKIHMRRVLDEDNRELRMYQEFLLDDGELHGTGRQRQFRWKNLDDNIEDDNRNSGDVDVYLEDDETEEEWRKRRHEREMFLKKEMEKSQRLSKHEDPLEGLTDSQILRLGQAALRKTQQNTPNEKTAGKSVVAKEPFFASFSSKRGSFLTRDDGVLARIAEMTRVSAEVVVAGVKSTKNVVFHSVQSTEESTVIKQVGIKRKGMQGTPKVIKKVKMQTSPVDR